MLCLFFQPPPRCRRSPPPSSRRSSLRNSQAGSRQNNLPSTQPNNPRNNHLNNQQNSKSKTTNTKEQNLTTHVTMLFAFNMLGSGAGKQDRARAGKRRRRREGKHTFCAHRLTPAWSFAGLPSRLLQSISRLWMSTGISKEIS